MKTDESNKKALEATEAANGETLLNRKEVAYMLGVSATTVWKMEVRGELHPLQSKTRGAHYRKSEVEAWIRGAFDAPRPVPGAPDALREGDDLITAEEAATLLGVGKTTICRLEHRGKLRTFRLAMRCLRYRRSDIEASVKAGGMAILDPRWHARRPTVAVPSAAATAAPAPLPCPQPATAEPAKPVPAPEPMKTEITETVRYHLQRRSIGESVWLDIEGDTFFTEGEARAVFVHNFGHLPSNTRRIIRRVVTETVLPSTP